MEEDRLYDVYAIEEDIEILEKLVKDFKSLKEDEYLEIENKYIQAIEHLLEAYGKVKEEELHWKGQYHLLSRKIAVIPESKVKEKIEEYTEKSKHPLVNSQSRREYTFGIKALQELLEEE